MCAKVLVDIEDLETTQKSIVAVTKDNKQLLINLNEGMASNLSTIKKNIEFLKSKSIAN